MSLPKRDGVHDRYYLIHKPDTSPEVLAEADLCIQDVLNGTARENHSAYPTVVRNHNGTPFLPDQLLERYLAGLLLKKFPCEDAVSVCDAMRRLVGWEERAFRFGSERPPDSRNGFLLQFHPTHPGCTDRRVPALRGSYLVSGSNNNDLVRRRVSANS